MTNENLNVETGIICCLVGPFHFFTDSTMDKGGEINYAK
jgi:hypothetical protein